MIDNKPTIYKPSIYKGQTMTPILEMELETGGGMVDSFNFDIL